MKKMRLVVAAGFEPATYGGVKVHCLDPLGDTTKVKYNAGLVG